MGSRQISYSMMSSLHTCYYVTSSTCGPLSFKMSAQKLQTSKECNENSPVRFDLLWFKMDPAVYTATHSSLLHLSPFCYKYSYGIRLTQPPK